MYGKVPESTAIEYLLFCLLFLEQEMVYPLLAPGRLCRHVYARNTCISTPSSGVLGDFSESQESWAIWAEYAGWACNCVGSPILSTAFRKWEIWNQPHRSLSRLCDSTEKALWTQVIFGPHVHLDLSPQRGLFMAGGKSNLNRDESRDPGISYTIVSSSNLTKVVLSHVLLF